MYNYDYEKIKELETWKVKMRKKPSIINNISKEAQNKINSILPDGYHNIVTLAIKNMTKVVLFGYTYTTQEPLNGKSLKERDIIAYEKIKFYKKTAMIEGIGTGAGGLLIGLADFPLLLGIKIKLLYELASIYGFDTRDYKERLYILNIFQLSFSSKGHVNQIFKVMENWDELKILLYDDINEFEWKKFQQEYRDYLDISKLLQLIPGVGAIVGGYVNNKLVDKLGEQAMYSYHLRLLDTSDYNKPSENWFYRKYKKLSAKGK